MVGHGGSSAGSYLADPTSPIPSHCAPIVATSTLRVNVFLFHDIKFVVSGRAFLHVQFGGFSMESLAERIRGAKADVLVIGGQPPVTTLLT